jgi:hypothetical protein
MIINKEKLQAVTEIKLNGLETKLPDSTLNFMTSAMMKKEKAIIGFFIKNPFIYLMWQLEDIKDLANNIISLEKENAEIVYENDLEKYME